MMQGGKCDFKVCIFANGGLTRWLFKIEVRPESKNLYSRICTYNDSQLHNVFFDKEFAVLSNMLDWRVMGYKSKQGCMKCRTQKVESK